MVLLAQNYNGTFAAEPIPAANADFNHDLGTAFAAVPEPSALAAIAACGFAGAIRRQRRSPCR